MKVIWWFPLYPGLNIRTMPAGARPLYAHRRQGRIVVYMLCDPSQVAVERTVIAVPTGEEFDADGFVPVGIVEPEPNLFFHIFVDDNY